MRYVINALLDCIDNIINGKCDEGTLVSTMGTLQNNASGKFCKADLLNYDEAAKLLGFGATNRVGLKRILDKYGIKQVMFGKTKVGFRRSEVMALKGYIEKEKCKNKKLYLHI